MRRERACIVAIVFLAVSGTLLASSDQQSGDDVLKQIQGTWKFISNETDGKAKSAAELAKMKITFTGDKWVVTDDGMSVQEGTHKFDPTKKPGHVDAVVTDGEGKGNTMLGIYEMTGDSMKVCFDPVGMARPTSLTAKGGQMGATVQREKKGP